MGKLIYDDAYANQLTGSLVQSADSLKTVVATVQKSFESGQGALPALLNDPEGKKRVYDLVENLRVTSANLATFSTSLQNGQGLVPRLLNDKQVGDQALSEFTSLVHQLNSAVTKLNAGEGTAGKLISDPSVYESINDILIGINESKMLRWLIRNRQQKGIDKRVRTEQMQEAPPPPPPPKVAPAATRTEVAPIAPPVTVAKDGASAATTTNPPQE